jgi:hypothetical protein
MRNFTTKLACATVCLLLFCTASRAQVATLTDQQVAKVRELIHDAVQPSLDAINQKIDTLVGVIQARHLRSEPGVQLEHEVADYQTAQRNNKPEDDERKYENNEHKYEHDEHKYEHDERKYVEYKYIYINCCRPRWYHCCRPRYDNCCRPRYDNCCKPRWHHCCRPHGNHYCRPRGDDP